MRERDGDKDHLLAEVARLRLWVDYQEAMLDAAVASNDPQMTRTAFRRLTALRSLLQETKRDASGLK